MPLDGLVQDGWMSLRLVVGQLLGRDARGCSAQGERLAGCCGVGGAEVLTMQQQKATWRLGLVWPAGRKDILHAFDL